MASRYSTHPDRWRATWRDDNGKQKSKGGFHTEKQAEEYEEQMKSAKAEGLLGRRTLAMNTPLRDWVQEWWRLHIDVAGRPGNTKKSYARAVNERIDPYLGGVVMARLDTPRIAQWRDELTAAGFSAHQVNEAMRVLSSCLAKAAERGLLPNNVNPVRDASKPPKPPKRVVMPLSPIEVERIRLEFLLYRPRAENDLRGALRSATLVSIKAYGGLRPEEYAGAKVRDVDFEAGGIWVRDVFAEEHREGDTKTHGYRFVDLDPIVMKDLRLWLDVRGGRGGDWLFPDVDGNVTNLTHKNWRRPFRKACERVSAANPDMVDTLTGFRPYDLRHTCVSLEVRSGNTSLADLAERMGHTVQTMINNYTHVVRALKGMPIRPVSEQLAEARERIGTDAAAAEVHARLMAKSAPSARLVDFTVERARRRAS